MKIRLARPGLDEIHVLILAFTLAYLLIRVSSILEQDVGHFCVATGRREV